jgi:cell wall-associated NlpC family hydrolase
VIRARVFGARETGARTIVERLIRPVVAAAVAIALAACASTSMTARHSGESRDAPVESGSSKASGFTHAPGPRGLMVDNALSMLGQPYRFGGAAPGGFDCSGLVKYAANGAGIRVPRTAHEQLAAGMPVARRELRAGDLVFMHIAHKELHVGIAIDSERFIHAPSSGSYVRIDSLAAPPFARGYIGARRISAAP